jgi:hypothetical protein
MARKAHKLTLGSTRSDFMYFYCVSSCFKRATLSANKDSFMSGYIPNQGLRPDSSNTDVARH